MSAYLVSTMLSIYQPLTIHAIYAHHPVENAQVHNHVIYVLLATFLTPTVNVKNAHCSVNNACPLMNAQSVL